MALFVRSQAEDPCTEQGTWDGRAEAYGSTGANPSFQFNVDPHGRICALPLLYTFLGHAYEVRDQFWWGNRPF